MKQNSRILVIFEMINFKLTKSLLTGEKYIPELNLKEPGFTYRAFEPFTKHRDRTQKIRETSNLKHLYRNELDKACCAHYTSYSDRKDLAKRTASGKVFKDEYYKIAKNPKHDGYQRALASIVYKFFLTKKQDQE